MAESSMNSIYLHKDDLQLIAEFMNAFPESTVVEVQSDTSSGIGAIVTATLHHVDVNGIKVSVTRTISDESSW